MKNIVQIIIIFSLLGSSGCNVFKKKKGKTNTNLTQHEENQLVSLLIEATTEKIIGNLEGADSLFKECLKIDSRNAVSFFELSGIYRLNKNPAKSIEYAKKAMQYDPSNEWYKANLALFYSELNDYKEASKLFEQLSDEYPERYEYLYSLSECYYLLNEIKKAIEPLNRLEELIGLNEDLIIYKHHLYLNIGEHENAILEIKKLIAADPGDVRYYGIMAELYEAIGDDQSAFKQYEKIISLDPENGIVQVSLFQYYLSKKEDQKAFPCLKKAFYSKDVSIDTKINLLLRVLADFNIDAELKTYVNDLFEILISTHNNNPKAYSIYAEFLQQEYDLEGALKNFKLAAKLNDNTFSVWDQIILLESHLLLYDQLEIDTEKAIELFPSNPTFYFFNGFANLQLKNYKNAISAFNNGIQYIINDNFLLSEFYQYLGDAYHQNNDDLLSDDSYEESLNYNPNNTYVLNNYSYYLTLRETKLNIAEKMILRALEISPNNVNYLDTYGWILFMKHDFVNAEVWIKKALNKTLEKNGIILEHYGDVLFHLEKVKDAILYWEKALENGNNSSILKEKISEKKYLK